MAFALALSACAGAADVLCGTWNLQWFPSGRAEHRASPRVEGANVADAAETIRAGIGSAKDVILFLQELRDSVACSNLIAAIGVPNLKVAGVSAFRDWDRRLQWQQCAIATTLPVVETSWSYWRREGKVTAPRGYVRAVLDAGEAGRIVCYGLHLKSNYGASKPAARAGNRLKREMAIRQLTGLAKGETAVVIAGDFNTDPFSGQFAGEKTCLLLTEAGFRNCFEGVAERGTHPGTGRYPDSTLDFIFTRGLAVRGTPTLSPAVPLSDHRMVWLTVTVANPARTPRQFQNP